MKKNLLRRIILSTGFVFSLSSNIYSVPVPDIYIPFENSDGTSGDGSESNPGWLNIGASGPDQPESIGPVSAPTHPVIVSPGDPNYNGIKGGYEDMYNFGNPWTTPPDDMQGLHYAGSTTEVFDDAASMTVAFWCRSCCADRPGPVSHTYVLNKLDMSVRWRTDAKLFLFWNGVWFWTPNPTANSDGEWIFLAVTVDTINDVVTFYRGTQTQPVVAIETLTAIAIDPLRINGATSNLSKWGNIDFAGPYPGYYMDEFRVYTDKFDNSGALSIDDLDIIRRSAMGPVCGDDDHPYPVGDLSNGSSLIF